MTAETFKHQLTALADDPSSKDGEIISLIIHYFSDKGLPHIEFPTPIIMRCGLLAENEKLTAERCSYPPSRLQHKISLQRANYDQEQVFYCATGSGLKGEHAGWTAIIETVNALVKDESTEKFEVILSTWVCTRPLRLWILPFSEVSCQVNPLFRQMRDDIEAMGIELLNADEKISDALGFISDKFWTNKNLQSSYRITTAYYHALKFFDKEHGLNFDGLMYPSCHTKGAGINIVLKKEVVDTEVIVLEKFDHLTITRHEDDPKQLSIALAS